MSRRLRDIDFAQMSGAPAPPARRRTENGNGLEADLHEILKREAFASETRACDSHFEKSRPCPDEPLGVSDQHLLLDSWCKNEAESDPCKGVFAWSLMVQGSTRDEALGVRYELSTITEVAMGAFALPILEEDAYAPTATPYPAYPDGLNTVVLVQNNGNAADPALPDRPVLVPNAFPYGQYPPPLLAPGATVAVPWVNNPYSQTPFYSQMTVQLAEAGLQSYSDRRGGRHHFDYLLTYPGLVGANPHMLRAVPAGGVQPEWSCFAFTDPLKDLPTVTLSFRNPDAPVRFLPDSLQATAGDDGAGAPAPGSFLRFTAPGHRLRVGERVYFDGFQSGNAALDAAVNRAEGWAASAAPGTAPYPPSGAPIPTPDEFWTDPAISLVDLTEPAPALPAGARVRPAARRLRIPFRARSVVNRLTNYKHP